MAASEPVSYLEVKMTGDASGAEVTLYRKFLTSRKLAASKPSCVSPDATIDGLSAIAELPLLTSVNTLIQGMASEVREIFLQEQPRCL